MWINFYLYLKVKGSATFIELSLDKLHSTVVPSPGMQRKWAANQTADTQNPTLHATDWVARRAKQQVMRVEF